MPLPTESRFSKFCCIYLRTHNQNAISNCDDANTQNYMTFLTFMLIQQYGNAMWCYSLRFVKIDILFDYKRKLSVYQNDCMKMFIYFGTMPNTNLKFVTYRMLSCSKLLLVFTYNKQLHSYFSLFKLQFVLNQMSKPIHTCKFLYNINS